LANYAAGLIHFTAFCNGLNVPEEQRMPASEDLLWLFISVRAVGSISDSCMKTWLAGLELWHTLNGAPWNGSKILAHILKGAAKLAPDSSQEKKCQAITIQHIRALRLHLNLADSFDMAVWATACVAFWSCCQ